MFPTPYHSNSFPPFPKIATPFPFRHQFLLNDRQTNRQTDKRQTYRQTVRQTERQTDEQTTDKQTDKHTCIKTSFIGASYVTIFFGSFPAQVVNLLQF